ncbi:MAG TPA: hypothetical protein PK006_12975, partial [Saprospiraceae bacterium]|nr:hypothetical protein [Saprospiraceae bacterium]
KDLHNFLVGDLGVVVHNGCSFADLLAFFKNVIKLKGSNIPKRINLHLRYLFMMQKIDLQLR